MKGSLKKPAVRRPFLPDYLNWLYFWKGAFLVTRNSLLLAFLEILPGGDYYDPASDDATVSAVNSLIMTLPDEITFWYETGKVPRQEAEIENTISNFKSENGIGFESLRYEAFQGRDKGFEIRRTLVFSFKPTFQNDSISIDSFEAFDKILQSVRGRLGAVGIKVKRMDRNAVCTYLHSIISTNRHGILEPSSSSHALADALWDDDIDPTLVPLRLGDHLISVITVDDLPDKGTSPELLAGILKVPGLCRWVTRFTVKRPEEAKKIIDTRRRQYLSRRFSARDIAAQTVFNSNIELMDTGEVNKYQECELALEDNGKEVCFGFYTGLIVLEAENEEELYRSELYVKDLLAHLGFVYRSEGLNLFASWLSSLPGSLEANPRKLFISSGNIACLLSLTSPYHGERTNRHMQKVSGCGASLGYGLLPDASVYHLNLNGTSDVGHTFILGPTGSGKSLLLLYLAASFGRYPEGRVIYFDKGRASEKLSKLSNGSWICPCVDGTVFQPLRNANEHKERCMAFLEAVAGVQNIVLSAFDRKDMTECLSLMIPGRERISTLIALLKGRNHQSEIAAALENYSLGGAWGNLFDSGVDALDPKAWPSFVSIEMGALMDMGDSVVIPALSYLTGQMDELFMDRRPTLLILDEAWAYFRHPVFRNFIENWLKTLRKFNVFVVMATQEVSDFSELMKSVLTNCHTKILLPNEAATTPSLKDLYKGIGLEESEISLLANSRKMLPKRDYFVLQSEGKAVVNFNFSEEELGMLR